MFHDCNIFLRKPYILLFQSAVQRQTKPIITTLSMQIHVHRERVAEKGEESYGVNNEESVTLGPLCKNAEMHTRICRSGCLSSSLSCNSRLKPQITCIFFGESD